MSGTRGLLGWSWIFILEGIITVAVGLISFIVLVDFPATAKFLTPEEQAFVIWKKKYDNSSVGEEEKFEVKHIYQAFTDWQVWIHILIYMSLIGPLYGITLFLPTIISNFGEFSTPISQLLTVPPYVFATIVLGFFAYYSDKVMMRSPFILAAQIMCLIGFSINIANVSHGAKYFGTFLIVAGSYSGFPGIVAWLSNNLSGQYKRGIGMALHIGIGNFSGAIASNIFRTQDKPRFILGHGIELMFVGIGLIFLPITVFTYSRINKKRAEFMNRVAEGLEKKPSPEELRALGDRAPDFRSFTLSTHDEKASEHRLEHGRSDYDFGGESQLPPPPDLSQEDERKLWRKIDLRLMPILCVIYLMSFMDRGNIGNAKLQGLETQLKLTGNRYNIALSPSLMLSMVTHALLRLNKPYCIFECPANLVLKKFRPSIWLPGITVVWGTVMTLMGLVKTYPQLVGVRVCLGIAEAGLFPGVAYYLSLWYPRNALQSRIGLFFGAATIAGAFSGLFAFSISFMSGTRGLLGWSWIFIIEGIITVAVGLISFLILVDFPVTADFLTPEERAFVVWKKKFDNSSVGEEERFMVEHVYQAFTDWQVWIHLLIYISLVGPYNSAANLVNPANFDNSEYFWTIISDFGEFSTAISQLLTVPPYIFATIVLGLFAYYSDKVMMRSPFILAAQIMCLIGFSINIANVSTGAKYFGTFLIVAGSYAGFPGIVAWLGNNLCGQYKRGVGMALHIGIGNFSGAIASNIFRTQDKPRFILGHAIELMFVGIGLICLPITVIIYSRINKKRAYFMSRVADGLERKPSPEECIRTSFEALLYISPVISEPTEFLRVATVYLS
ncbi:MFS general substrate transporter [Lentinula edodes]|uniref:MFS general substrate transporter n=1 Tax=Lentinula edodes TaxID=5353 RepID=A0A1Q3E3S4_LENED|nr:MFS general substrate transporter [Lentinula edodes]